jgi:hypothetical protein
VAAQGAETKRLSIRLSGPGHYRPLKTGLLFPSKGKGASSLMGVPINPGVSEFFSQFEMSLLRPNDAAITLDMKCAFGR